MKHAFKLADGDAYVIERFSSIGAAAAAAAVQPYSYIKGNRDFYGVNSLPEFADLLMKGDPKLTELVKASFSKLDLKPVHGIRKQWTNSVAGSRACVPSFLAGRPDAMKTRANVKASNPVRIYVSSVCSGGVTAEQMAQRGAVIAALVHRLCQTKPVELFVTMDMKHGGADHSYIGLVPVNTRPLNLDRLAVMLCHVATGRAIGFSLSGIDKGGESSGLVQWPFDTPTFTDNGKAKMIEALHLNPASDLFISGLHLGDPLLTKPKQWLAEQVARFA